MFVVDMMCSADLGREEEEEEEERGRVGRDREVSVGWIYARKGRE